MQCAWTFSRDLGGMSCIRRHNRPVGITIECAPEACREVRTRPSATEPPRDLKRSDLADPHLPPRGFYVTREQILVGLLSRVPESWEMFGPIEGADDAEGICNFQAP